MRFFKSTRIGRKARTRLYLLCAFFLFLCLQNVPVTSQTLAPVAGTDIRPFSMSGNVGFLSEAYAVSGINARRPPGMGQISAATRFSIFGFRSGINLLYSTDNNALRQSMNRFTFQGSWRWLSVSAGSVNPRFSKYSLNGVTVNGALLEINPGHFSLSIAGGRTRRAVELTSQPGFREPSFEQWLFASRIGVGRRGGNQFALTGLYSYDVLGSVANPGNALPAENLNITPEFGLVLWGGKVSFESSLSVSVFTRDRTSDELELDEVPAFFTSIFTPRTSTRVDYAGEVMSRFSRGPFRIDSGYERIQPGFRSLGLGYVRSDQETYRVRPQVRILGDRANISGMFSKGRNNLLDTRVTTTQRQQLGLNTMVRLTQSVNMTLSYIRLTNETKPVDTSTPIAMELHQKQVSRSFMLSPSFLYRSGLVSHSVTVTGSYQILDDKSESVTSGDRQAFGFTNFNSGLSYNISLPGGLSLGVSGNYLRNESDHSKATGHAANTTGGYAFFNRLLSVNLTVGWSRNGTEFVRIIEEFNPSDPAQGTWKSYRTTENSNDFLEGEYTVRQWSNQYSLNLSASYRLPNGNQIRMNVRGMSSRPNSVGSIEYDEMRASIRYDHRF